MNIADKNIQTLITGNLFRNISGLKKFLFENAILNNNTLYFKAKSITRHESCPYCGKRSRLIHSELATPYSRKTIATVQILKKILVEVPSNKGAQICSLVSLNLSPSTYLRMVKSIDTCVDENLVKHVCIDDFAYKKVFHMAPFSLMLIQVKR